MRKLHEWNLTYAEAGELEVRLAGRVRLAPLKKEPADRDIRAAGIGERGPIVLCGTRMRSSGPSYGHAETSNHYSSSQVTGAHWATPFGSH